MWKPLQRLLRRRTNRTPGYDLDIRRHSRDELAPIGAQRNRQYDAVAAKPGLLQSHAPMYPSTRPMNFVQMGYAGNPVFRACVDLLVKAFCQGDLEVVDRVTRQPEMHPVFAVFQTITNMRGIMEVCQWLLIDLFTNGNCYYEKVRDPAGRVVQIWRLEPTRMRLQYVDDGRRLLYRYEVNGKWWPIEDQDVLHFKILDPSDPYRGNPFGSPPILAAWRNLSVESKLTDQMQVVLQNRGTPAVVLTPADGPQAQMGLDPDRAEAIKETWRQNFRGEGLGDVAVIDAKVQTIGMKWNEMDISQAARVPSSRIAMVHAVPSLLISQGGTTGDPTHANYENAKLELYEGTVTFLHQAVAELMTLYLLPEWPDWERLKMRFNVSNVPVLQRARVDMIPSVVEGFKAGLYSRHVGQGLLGMELHLPDVAYRSATVDGIIPANATSEDLENPETDTGSDLEPDIAEE